MDDFKANDVNLVSCLEMIVPNSPSRYFGLVNIESGEPENLTAVMWNWGALYKKLVETVQNGAWDSAGADGVALNYWWGMSSGVIDVMLDDCLPEGVKVLAQALRRELQSGQLSPFDRSFSTQDGRLINAGGGKLSIDEILHMDYLCSCVSGHIPSFDEILPMARSMVRLQGVYRDQIPPEQEAPL